MDHDAYCSKEQFSPFQARAFLFFSSERGFSRVSAMLAIGLEIG
jgi:hypothetical protein